MGIEPGFFGRGHLFSGPSQHRQKGQGNHQSVSPKNPPVNARPERGALQVLGQAFGAHIFTFASGISHAINIGQCSALPSERVRRQPFAEELAQSHQVALPTLNRLAGHAARTEQRLQLAPDENPFRAESAMNDALFVKTLEDPGESDGQRAGFGRLQLPAEKPFRHGHGRSRLSDQKSALFAGAHCMKGEHVGMADDCAEQRRG